MSRHQQQSRSKASRRLNFEDTLDRLVQLFAESEVPEFIRRSNGSDFTAYAVRAWLARVGVATLYIKPASP